jgi:hypothetical protein
MLTFVVMSSRQEAVVFSLGFPTSFAADFLSGETERFLVKIRLATTANGYYPYLDHLIAITAATTPSPPGYILQS